MEDGDQKLKDDVKFRVFNTWMERMTIMRFVLPIGNPLKTLKSRADDVGAMMATLDYPLNPNQLGVTLCAVQRLEKGDTRQIYSVPAGQGKSRIILGIIAALYYSNLKAKSLHQNIHVVYNHRQCQEDDLTKIARLCFITKSNYRFSIATQDITLEQLQKDEVMIIDEVDAILIDKTATISRSRALGSRLTTRIIGLTATTTKEMLQYESMYYEKLGFSVHDSGIRSSHDTEPTKIGWKSYFLQACKGKAGLVYIQRAKCEAIESLAR